jgi:uncharacterized protein (DUF488 family)
VHAQLGELSGIDQPASYVEAANNRAAAASPALVELPFVEPTLEAAQATASSVTVYTIGFTKKTAEQFFGLLASARIEQLVDTRVHPNSQLSGFAKGNDLPFLLQRLVGAAYEHRLDFAPTEALLRDYRNKIFGWEGYEERYKALLAERRVEEQIRPGFFDARTVLLCSEASSKRCHRRLLVEYLSANWGELHRVDL